MSIPHFVWREKEWCGSVSVDIWGHVMYTRKYPAFSHMTEEIATRLTPSKISSFRRILKLPQNRVRFEVFARSFQDFSDGKRKVTKAQLNRAMRHTPYSVFMQRVLSLNPRAY